MSNSHLFLLSILLHKKIELESVEQSDIEFLEFLEVLCPGSHIVEIGTQGELDEPKEKNKYNSKYQFIPGILLNQKQVNFVFSTNIAQFIDSFLLLCSFLKIELVITGMDEIKEKTHSESSGNEAEKNNNLSAKEHYKDNFNSSVYFHAPLYNIIPKLCFLSMFNIQISHHIESIRHPLNGLPCVKLTIRSTQAPDKIKSITLKNNPKQIFATLINHEGNKFVVEQIRKWLKNEIENIKIDHIRNIRTWSPINDEVSQLKKDDKGRKIDRLSPNLNRTSIKNMKTKKNIRKRDKVEDKPCSKDLKNTVEPDQNVQRRGVTCLFYSGHLFSCFTVKKMNEKILEFEMSELFKKILRRNSVDEEITNLMFIMCSMADGISNVEIDTELDEEETFGKIKQILPCQWISNRGLLNIRGIGYKFEQ